MIGIYKNGRFSRASKAFPVTRKTVRKLAKYIVSEVGFLVLKPGVQLPYHTDNTNAQLTCHLGVVVPSQCGIGVNGEERRWSEGKVTFFDHSYVHTAWNNGDTPRVVLLLDLRHPDISDEEHLLHESFRRELNYRVAPLMFLRRAARKVRRLF